MSFLIREAQPADAHDMAKVIVLSWQSAYRGIVPDDYLMSLNIDERAQRFKQSLASDTEKMLYYVAEENGMIIGNLVMSESHDEDKSKAGQVIAIYLLQEYRGMGHGKKMMDFAVNSLRKLGYSNILIWVFEDNAIARNFYEKYGFEPDGAKKETFRGKPLIEVRYELVLQ